MSHVSLCGSAESSSFQDHTITIENWESFVNDIVYESLRMKKSNMKNTLVELVVLRNDLNCLCHKINTLKSEHKSDVFCLETKITLFRRNETLSPEDKAKFIDEVITELSYKNDEFEKNIFEFQTALNDKNRIAKLKKSFYFQTKFAFNELYLLTVKDLTDLKYFACCSEKVKIDERLIFLQHFTEKIIRDLEIEETKMKKYFDFIDSLCEDDTDGLLKQCKFAPSDEKIECGTGKSIYELRSELQKKREDTIAYVKDHLGCALIEGFAGIQMYKPPDPVNYLANYLLKFKRNLILAQSHVSSLQNLAQRQQMLFQKENENLDYKMFCQGP